MTFRPIARAAKLRARKWESPAGLRSRIAFDWANNRRMAVSRSAGLMLRVRARRTRSRASKLAAGFEGSVRTPSVYHPPRHALKPPGLAAGPSSSNGCGGVCCGGSVGKGFSVVRPRPTCVPGSTAGFQLTQAFGLHVLTGTYRDSSGVWSTSAILCPANVRTGARVLVRSRSRGAGHLFKKAAGVCAGQAGEAMGLHGLLPRG